ncbi:MAG: galK [Gammaproteobacteria bacterium]|nr:galK [Gammaproteobacteria bacterium]
MLLGEYAVLQGGHALVCAVEKRIDVSLKPRMDNRIELMSGLGHLTVTLSQLKIIPPFQFVLATLKKYRKWIKQGCNITIQSEFSDQIGLASSAAVTVAVLAALKKWLELSYSPLQLIREARQIVQSVQGVGSGADVAACVLGGMVAYRKNPLIAERIECFHPLTLVYSGSKTPTVTAINQVKKYFSSKSILFKQLLRAINICAQQGITAVKTENFIELGHLMTIQQSLMAALGVNTPPLQAIVEKLIAEPGILAAKISGSGLGDCVVGLGTAKNIEQMPITIAMQGVRCEKI